MRTIKRKDWNKYKRLGKGSKKKIKWRKAKGRHNKIRESIRGHQQKPSIGMKKQSKNEKIIMITNIKELNKAITSGIKAVVINRRIGNKKKVMIIEVAKNKGIKIKNDKKKITRRTK